MKILFDFFPIVLFFISYKIFNIYYATVVAIIASLIQVLYFRFKYSKYDKMHVINFLLILSLGGATLFFHDLRFIKWKPTGIYWLTSLVFIGSTIFTGKPLLQNILGSNLILPLNIWIKLNWAWAMFLALLGGLNLYIAYNYDTDTWVNFKLFGTLSLTILFIILQTIYLSKYLSKKS